MPRGRGAGVPVAIDNTWGTPLYFRGLRAWGEYLDPIGTKYIVGHADALLGAITCDEPAAAAVASTHEAFGLCPTARIASWRCEACARLPCAWSGIGDQGLT